MRKERLINSELVSKEAQCSKEELELLNCPLCYGVVLEPVECTQCDTLFCKQHADKWMNEKGSCPACKLKPWRLKAHPHKAYQLMLTKLKFDCPCKEVVSYSKLEKHRFWVHLERKGNSKEDRSQEKQHENRSTRQKERYEQQKKAENHRQRRRSIPKKLEQSEPSLRKIVSESTSLRLNSRPTFVFSYKLGDIWCVFDRRFNKQLNMALPRSKLMIEEKDEKSYFDLTRMTMKNFYMQCPLQAEPYTGFLWRCYIKQDKVYHAYPVDINARLNQQYQLSQGKGQATVYHNNSTYIIDFARMIQTKQQTGYERRVQRTEY